MGYGGKVAEQQRARELRAEAWTLQDIATEFLVLGLAIYAAEGSKTDGDIGFANSDPRMIWMFVTWPRHFFEVDEARLRLKLYLHNGLDLDGAIGSWSELTGIPPSQFTKPYRAVADPTTRRTKHVMGCPGIAYRSASMHRRVMGLIEAVLSRTALPG